MDVYFVRVMVLASTLCMQTTLDSRLTESCSIIKIALDLFFRIVTYIREKRLIGKENVT